LKRRSRFVYRSSSIVDTRISSHAPQGYSRVRSLLVKLGLFEALNPNHHDRTDLKRIEVDENFRIDVFWKDVPAGKGPAMSVFVRGHEILRFDCFGQDLGHFHAGFADPPGASERRIYFRESTSREQIDRSVFEVGKNLRYYQQRSSVRSIRSLECDPRDLRTALVEAQEYLLNLAPFHRANRK